MKKYQEKKPWGRFEQFCKNEKCTVKIISVEPNEELSLQYHKKRAEFWRVIQGKAEIVIGGKTKKARQGDEFFIPKKMIHQIKSRGSRVQVLEISFGRFNEKDIVRLKDKYKR